MANRTVKTIGNFKVELGDQVIMRPKGQFIKS